MLELVNFSNISCDTQGLMGGSPDKLRQFLQQNGLQGIELNLYGQWDKLMPPADVVQGIHLQFWPDWLDFWQENWPQLMQEFGTKEKIAAYYGAANPGEWLGKWQGVVSQASEIKPKYVVFHVCSNRGSSIYNRQYGYSDKDVVLAAIDLLNYIMKGLPKDCWLLLENLWWPGLTLQDPSLCRQMLAEINHPSVGIMLDTGHLMNTNWQLQNQQDGVEYVERIVRRLGELRKYIKGIHLHQSISGAYAAQMAQKYPQALREQLSWEESFAYISKVDRHQPFSIPEARRIIELVQPEFLVHEFIPDGLADWEKKITTQRQALGLL